MIVFKFFGWVAFENGSVLPALPTNVKTKKTSESMVLIMIVTIFAEIKYYTPVWLPRGLYVKRYNTRHMFTFPIKFRVNRTYDRQAGKQTRTLEVVV